MTESIMDITPVMDGIFVRVSDDVYERGAATSEYRRTGVAPQGWEVVEEDVPCPDCDGSGLMSDWYLRKVDA